VVGWLKKKIDEPGSPIPPNFGMLDEPLVRIRALSPKLDEMEKVKLEPCSISPAYREIYCIFAVQLLVIPTREIEDKRA